MRECGVHLEVIRTKVDGGSLAFAHHGIDHGAVGIDVTEGVAPDVEAGLLALFEADAALRQCVFAGGAGLQVAEDVAQRAFAGLADGARVSSQSLHLRRRSPSSSSIEVSSCSRSAMRRES